MKKIYVILLTLICLMGFGLSFNKVEATVEVDTTALMTSFSDTSGNVGIDANVTYSAAQGGGTSAPAINSNQIRLYQNSNGTGGGYITIVAKNDAKIKSITIGSSMDTSVAYSEGSADATKSAISSIAENGTYTYTASSDVTSVTFHCMGTTSKTRLYVNSLSVTYSKAASGLTVTYLNGQTNEVISTETLSLNGTGKATKPATDPTVSGYKFIGWYNGNVKYDFTQPVTSNLTIIAKFELLPVTIESVLSEKDTTKTYRVAGVVTGKTNASTAYIQDGDSAIKIYKSGLDSQIKVGKYVIVEGKYSVYNNNPQLSNVVFISESTTAYTKNTITNVNDVTESNLNRYVELSRLELSEIASKSYTIKGQNFTLFYTNESYVQGEETTYITGNLVDIKGVIVKENANVKIMITSIALTRINVEEAFANVKTEASLAFGYTETLGNEVAGTYSIPTYTSNTELPSQTYEQDGFSFVFAKGDAETPIRWWQADSGYRSYAGNTLTITMPNGGSVSSIDFGKSGVLNTSSSEAVAGTGDVTAYTLSDTNSDGKITLTFNKAEFNKIDITYATYASSYSNYNNIQLKFRYEFDPTNYTGEVTEQGFIVTDDSTFAFESKFYSTTDPEYLLEAGLANGKKLEKVVKNVTTDSFVLAIDVPIENGADSLYVCAYIVVNGTYYFATPINPTQNANNETVCGGYSVDSIIDKYVEAGIIPEDIIPVVRELQEVIYA